MQIVDFLDIDTKEITFKEPKPNKYNGSQIGILYKGQTMDGPVSNLKPIFSPSGKILKYAKKLPEPLKPTKYEPPQPRPSRRLSDQSQNRELSKRPVPLPRPRLPKL